MKASQHLPLPYRPDIDGLRAVAVLSVVLYHIDESLVPGGFTGVDIFFVISGYLITSILRRDILAGTFSLSDFYRRRLLRIGPAYFAVTFATLLAGALILLPEDMRNLAVSAGWSALALPNVYFWLNLDTGYFAAASNQIPLLHLWSLGVEEQFYVFWPLTLLLLGRWMGWRQALLGCVALLMLASFLMGQHAAMFHPSFAYYMLPARGGELLVGALLALRRERGPSDQEPSSVSHEWGALCGIALVGWGLFGLNDDSTFPGLNALFPTLGAALLIHCGDGPKPHVSGLLRLKPMVFIGLISYSLYLWHWPILAYARYLTTTLDTQTKGFSLVAMLALAYVSFRWIEVPFRQGRASRLLRIHALASFSTSVLTIGLVSFGLTKMANSRDSAILPGHAAEVGALKSRMQAAFAYEYNCQRDAFDAALIVSPSCVVGDVARSGGRVPALLIGDSNAAHYVGVLGAIAEAEGFAFRNLSVSSCPPLFGGGDKYGKPTDREGCSRYRREVRELATHYQFVFLGAQWTSHSRTKGFDADLHRTLAELGRNGATAVILGQVPRFATFNQNCELARISDPEMACEAERDSGVVAPINDYLKSLADRYPHVRYMDVGVVVCPGGQCSPYLADKPIYFDTGHLSMAGSWDVGRAMVESDIPLRSDFRGISVAASRTTGSSSASEQEP